MNGLPAANLRAQTPTPNFHFPTWGALLGITSAGWHGQDRLVEQDPAAVAPALTLWPAGLLDRPRRPLSQGFDPVSYPTQPLVSYQTYRQLSGWNLPGDMEPPITVVVFVQLLARIGRRAHQSRVAARSANTTRSKVRARVEHVFGDQKNAMGAEIGRTIGIVRARPSPLGGRRGSSCVTPRHKPAGF
jgi:hypothetical protein